MNYSVKKIIRGLAPTVAAAVLVVGGVLISGARAKDAPVFGPIEHYAAETSAANKRILPVYGVGTDKKVVALTIDAAWGADKTPEILKILDEKDVKATFFLVGRWVREFPDETKAIFDAGHVIGSHSDSHPHFCALSNAEIEMEITATEQSISELEIPKPSLFRPPFGEYDDRVIQRMRDLGYQNIQWSIDTLDWKEGRTVSEVLDVVERKVENGAIILCHNNANTIVDYLPKLIDSLVEKGYDFVTLPELLYDGFNIDANGIQHP